MYKWLKTHYERFETRMRTPAGSDLSNPETRRTAFWHFQLMDHAFLRVLWTNLAEIAPDVWRSNQPSPKRLERYKQMGIKTVLSLRGDTSSSHYLFEKEACEKLGLTLHVATLFARKAPRRRNLLELLDMFETIERPFVMHCKSGADRAGLASALYLIHIEGQPVDVAAKQLSWRFYHLKNAPTGILDHMLDIYAEDTKLSPMPIREWIQTRYKARKLTASFERLRGRAA